MQVTRQPTMSMTTCTKQSQLCMMMVHGCDMMVQMGQIFLSQLKATCLCKAYKHPRARLGQHNLPEWASMQAQGMSAILVSMSAGG